MILNASSETLGTLRWPHCVMSSIRQADFEHVASICLEQGIQNSGLENGLVSSIHRNVYRINQVSGQTHGLRPEDEWSIEETPCFHVGESKGVIHTGNLLRESTLKDMRFVQENSIQSLISAPIWVNRSLHGTLCYFSTQPHGGFTTELVQNVEMAAFGLGRFLEIEHFHQIKELLNGQLKEALEDVKALHGLLPICASCKKIRDVDGLWVKFEEYVAKHSLAQLSHGLCKPCVKDLYGFDPDEVELEDCECDKEN